MPQLMPLLWMVTIFMFVYLLFMVFDLYFYKKLEINFFNISFQSQYEVFKYKW